MSQNDNKKIDGKKQAAELLAGLDFEHRKRILDGIRKTDATLAAALEKGLYSFDQVLELDSVELQKVLQGLPQKLIALSVRGMDAGAKKTFLSKFSNRQAQLLEDEIQSLGLQRLSDVKQAQEKIAAHAGQLHEQGIIKLV